MRALLDTHRAVAHSAEESVADFIRAQGVLEDAGNGLAGVLVGPGAASGGH